MAIDVTGVAQDKGHLCSEQGLVCAVWFVYRMLIAEVFVLHCYYCYSQFTEWWCLQDCMRIYACRQVLLQKLCCSVAL